MISVDVFFFQGLTEIYAIFIVVVIELLYYLIFSWGVV